MIRYKKVLQEVAVSGECDRCSRKMPKDSPEFHERFSISYWAGYDSVFGDGNHVECDLCQHCVKELLGPWLKVSATNQSRREVIQNGKIVSPIDVDILLPEESAAISALASVLKQSAEKAKRAVDDALALVEASEKRLLKKKTGKR